ncbi:hypothetical protein NUU61_005963 [Penicillium alfredii]|uniref:Xylanolytic transcriptional activator regulatory domain-containing protein n=1 Tax=Penicillium alfredii TaxID=1506179 RepID=A0A9W9K2W8_9EURO|nr:uncharacterized protein NUU61_005963 [Penicillium alfredii]KAJ5091093.1 hypothetical protein NUU61_005963 [Penicillium alfredii]
MLQLHQAREAESTPSSARGSESTEIQNDSNTLYQSSPVNGDLTQPSKAQDLLHDLGYSRQTNHNTLGILRTTEMYARDDPSSDSLETTHRPGQSELYQRYKGLVRQLPSRSCINILTQNFFFAVNWQYDLLNERAFSQQLEAWGRVSYADLQAGFDGIPPEIRTFPALLFQVLAQALLYQHPDKGLEPLNTTMGMTLHDLGVEYSDAGAMILTLLGKRDLNTATVQAGLLRASFLKSSGKVVEAWHVLGSTIRDAQEIGLHTGRVVSDSSPPTSEYEMTGLPCCDVHHRIWIVLHIWDIHMAVVLGRPIVTELQLDAFARNVEDDEKQQNVFSNWKTETNPPRPFDIILAGYSVAYRYFPQIHRLENNGAHLEDYGVVEDIHAAIQENLLRLPSWCRLENADPKFDQCPGCQWLPVAREGLFSLIHLVLLTLHRPYVFSVAKSRTAALEAGIAILRAQERLFPPSETRECKVFNPVYASFDAIVLIAAIYIAFPGQNNETLEEAIQVVERGMQRLKNIGHSNPMARSAYGVVCSLYCRLKCRLSGLEPRDESPNSTGNQEQLLSNNHDAAHSVGPFNALPPELSFDTIMPPRPTHDLFYDHLSGTEIPPFDPSDGLLSDSFTTDLTDNWKFDGIYSDTSFWSLMNDFNR